jgi:hypothetical protein
MRITEMKLAGRLNKNNLPEYFATIHRTPGNDYITVTIIDLDSEREHIVEADSPEDSPWLSACSTTSMDAKAPTRWYMTITGFWKTLQTNIFSERTNHEKNRCTNRSSVHSQSNSYVGGR